MKIKAHFLTVGTALLLVLLASAQQDCAKADSIECNSQLCRGYSYTNYTCVTNSTHAACSAGQNYYNNSCVTCSNETETTCSINCPDYVFKNGSCQSCSSYGANCVRCNTSSCTECAYSSHQVVNSAGSCTATTCTVSNCIECYSNGTQKCYRCHTGYQVDSNSACVVSTCNIDNCMNCANATDCQLCFPGYTLSIYYGRCQPECSDPNCQTCIHPNQCRTAVSGYKVVSGVATIDCTAINVANCAQCSSYTTCTKCDTGYTLVAQGTLCQSTCTVTNCLYCPDSAATCKVCNKGYDLVSNACTASSCYIEYCASCSTTITCETCITGFSLASSNTACTSDCAVANCLFCSGASCTTCMAGYNLASSTSCTKICSISNCQTCLSTSTCALCNDGYELNSNKTNCDMVCRVQGCSACTTTSSTSCTGCMTGYTLTTRSTNSENYCRRDCPIGYTNTATGGSVSCASCNTNIANCQQCTHNTNLECTRCQTGYFINGFSCVACSVALSNCLDCDRPTACTICNTGYKLVNNQCSSSACPNNCYACQNSTTCSICNPGFTLSGGSCTATTCVATQVFNDTTGSCGCPAGTYLVDTTCTACNYRCSLCSARTCYSCEEGYYPSGSSCVTCISNCKTCKSSTSCEECELGYSMAADGTCTSYGSGTSVTIGSTGNYYQCPSGCLQCIESTSSSPSLLSCLVTMEGYSIVNGVVVKCDPNCKECQASSTSTCTACYPGSVLRSGICDACTAANAITCSYKDLNYALSCKEGYTATYNSGGNGGICRACGSYCTKCDQNGPGNCDPGHCQMGSVFLLGGNTNCTLCVNGCARCSDHDPNTCESCGPRRYLAGTCQTCPIGCQTCSSSTACQSCVVGYSLVNSLCVATPQFCAVVSSSTGLCQTCFHGYSLSSNVCTASPCSSSCTNCPKGYYLSSSSVCNACTLGSNCVNCDPGTPGNCLQCANGYYLATATTCTACATGCSRCSSGSICKMASDGYYLALDPLSGEPTGEVAACTDNCATCYEHSNFCLSCATGYVLIGVFCQRNVYLRASIQYGPSSSGSVFNDSDNRFVQAIKTIRDMNSLGYSIFDTLPAGFKNGRTTTQWRQVLRFTRLAAASVQVDLDATSQGYTNSATAQSDFTSAISGGVPGYTFLSSSIVSSGFNSSSQSSTNLGLVLGLSIPLSILLVLIVVILVYSYRREVDTTSSENDKFYSEDGENNQTGSNPSAPGQTDQSNEFEEQS